MFTIMYIDSILVFILEYYYTLFSRIKMTY